MSSDTATPKAYPDCWIFDQNRRVYRRSKDGRSFGSPIWREHWRKVEIIGETSRSWLTDVDGKIPKKGGHGIAFSHEDIDKAAFVQNSWRIADAVRSCRDYDALRKVADAIGYEPPKGDE